VEIDSNLLQVPEDSASLRALVQQLLLERDHEKRRAQELKHHADEQQRRAEEHQRRVDEQIKQTERLQVELLRVKLELERYKKCYYGPRADWLQSDQDVAQMLLNFAEELDCKPVPAEDLAAAAEELRRVKRRKGRRNLANFENLPVRTHVYELSEAERACPCCGLTRKEIGADESWQVEYLPGHFERIHHVRKKYACTSCETNGENPGIQAAKKPETAIDKGHAGPGLLAYIVTSKFSDYLPLYRLEDIFARQGFEISRATQSVWCGDVADCVEPLYHLMADRVRASHVVATDDTIMPMQNKDKVANARMWVYVGDEAQPYNVFDFTMDRGRDGPTRFLKDYGQVLLADGYAGYNGVVVGNAIRRAGCWAHMKRKIIDAEKSAPEIATGRARKSTSLQHPTLAGIGRRPQSEPSQALDGRFGLKSTVELGSCRSLDASRLWICGLKVIRVSGITYTLIFCLFRIRENRTGKNRFTRASMGGEECVGSAPFLDPFL
jgi:transposase